MFFCGCSWSPSGPEAITMSSPGTSIMDQCLQLSSDIHKCTQDVLEIHHEHHWYSLSSPAVVLVTAKCLDAVNDLRPPNLNNIKEEGTEEIMDFLANLNCNVLHRFLIYSASKGVFRKDKLLLASYLAQFSIKMGEKLFKSNKIFLGAPSSDSKVCWVPWQKNSKRHLQQVFIIIML